MDDSEVGPEQTESELVDVSTMPLGELLSSDDSVLENSLRRVLSDVDGPQEIIAAFGSYAHPPTR